MAVKKKMAILFLVDLVIIWFSICSAYFFRFEGPAPEQYANQMFLYCAISSVLCGLSMAYFGMYRKMWQYASVSEMFSMCVAVTIGWGLSFLATTIVSDLRVPLSVAVRTLETSLLLIGGIRVIWRVIRLRQGKGVDRRIPTLIYGAGDCGALVAREFKGQAMDDHKLIGFVDDARDKHNLTMHGLPVLGGRADLPTLVEVFKIKEIIIAIPSVPRSQVSEIINLCMACGVKIKIIPGINDLIKGKISVSAIRNVDVEDLLGRDPVHTDLQGIADYVHNKVVLITGAGGSIGSELCRQVASFAPDKLLLLGHGENSIYTIEMELKHKFPGMLFEPIIADIQDRRRMEEVFDAYRPQVVFHAAAHKHVPLMEKNPAEAVKNNVFGTQNVADCADKYGTERFVLVSSDKAVNPTSVMGATKRIAEMYVQSLNASSRTRFASVRFGNVLGSRGSVIPAFKAQIARGGPVTVTDPQMVRYFMTIPEAVQLVIQAGAISQGGEIFILDMGEPVQILKLAEDLIRLSGYEPYIDIPIHFTGIREGEKLFEELLTAEEGASKTQHERIYIGKPEVISREDLARELNKLNRVIAGGADDVKEAIEQLVPLYEQVS
ncbi:polysaccharide biosynthesis protein [Cohnella sp. GCM10012308]|uniref:polysaccharide biosynthesis protein n=1 Tax=Cohnella sp. GCM10012308 TaxID=3317329 RepID=UPI00360EE547